MLIEDKSYISYSRSLLEVKVMQSSLTVFDKVFLRCLGPSIISPAVAECSIEKLEVIQVFYTFIQA